MSCIHGKLVYDSLAKQAMVQIGILDGFESAISSFLTEIMIGQTGPWTQNQRHRDHKDIHKNIEELETDMLQQVYQQPMHACTSVCFP